MSEPFYRTTFSFSVLSEEPIPNDIDIADVISRRDEGEYVMVWPGLSLVVVAELTGKEMADALYAASSDLSFAVHYRPDAKEES